jgi:hypothetical membrane protein
MSMRTLYALAVFIGTTIVLVVLMGALGGVGSIELLLAVVLAAAITVLWVNRRRGRLARQA